MKHILDSFCSVSGKTPNWSKSGIIFSKHVQPTVSNGIKTIFPVQEMDSSFIHLGHPLILPAKNRTSAYNFVLDKFKSKLSTYKADKLSHAACLKLIKLVFSSIPVYYMSNILFTKKFVAKLTSIVRNFWWTRIRDETKTKSLCLRAWKDLCAPKKDGGLGIRNLQAVNQSLILMAAWRLAENPNEHLHRVLKAKYFHNTSIGRTNSNVPKSAFWASILKMLPILKAHTCYQLTQGNISIWNTPWYPHWASIYDHLVIQQPGFIYPAYVKDLWLPNQKTWNVALIDNLFVPSAASSIKQTPIIYTDEQDLLCWNLTTNGKCNTKSAYYACLQVLHEQRQEEQPRPPTPQTTQLLMQVWKSKEIIPRIQIFGWRFLRKALPTGARAGKYSKHISKFCCRCCMQEDEVHLFFTCPFVKAAWFIAPWHLRTEFIVANCANLTDIILKLLAMNHPHATLPNILTFMWCIWKSRNDMLFQQKKCEPYQIYINSHALMKNLEICSTNSHKQTGIQDQKQVPTEENTIPLQGATLQSVSSLQGGVFFSDASWKENKCMGLVQTTTAGLGVYFCFDAGHTKWRIRIQASTQQPDSPFQAEAKALQLAAQLASILHIDRPTFLTDNQVLAKIAAARPIDHPLLHWKARECLGHFFRYTSSMSPQVYHISRCFNGEAHRCATQALGLCLQQPIYRCSNPAHLLQACPLLAALQHVNLQDTVITAASCS